jgi:dephospho-CoA kinase
MRNKPVRIGVTGGIGSGKSLACKYFEKLGYNVIYADYIAKELYTSNKQLLQNLVKVFGKGILDEKGNLSRVNSRKIIFKSKKNIKRVNSIVHPFVIREIDRQIRNLNSRIVLIETAIMFESGYYRRNDYNILVYANKSLRLKRVSERDKVSKASVEKLMKLQMPEQEKMLMADFIIKNNGTPKKLFNDIKQFSKILSIL